MTGWLVRYALQASVPLAAGLILTAALRARSAAVRHTVLASSIVAGLAMPALWLVAPVWQVFPHVAPNATVVATPRLGASVDTVTEVIAASPAHAETAPARPSAVGVEALVLWTWTFGLCAVALVVLAGLARLRWLASQARPVNDGPWHELLDEACCAAGVTNDVRLLQSDHRWLLATWGSRRPTLFLPAEADAWPADRIRVVLVHELAHMARRDWLWQLAAEGLRGALWFHPLVWLAVRRLRVESEHACDDVVLESGVAADAFAGELVSLARLLKPPGLTALPAPAMARPSSLEGRVQAMLNTTLDRRPASRTMRGAVAALLFAIALPVAAIRAQAFYTIAGHVSDPMDRPLANATLTLKNQETGQLAQIQSDANGNYHFVGLPSAAYGLDVKLAGFETLRVTDLAINGDVQRDVRLSVGSLEETVTVSAASQTRAPVQLASATNVAQRQQKAEAACSAADTSTAGGRIIPPVKVADADPIYPAAEQASGVGGVVTMDAVIGVDGVVTSVDDLSGADVALQNAAADAVRQWRYSQTLLNCQAIPVHMKVTVNFRARAQ